MSAQRPLTIALGAIDLYRLIGKSVVSIGQVGQVPYK
jgi:hypothetical protein